MRHYPLPRALSPELHDFYNSMRSAVETGARIHTAQAPHYRVDSTRMDADTINLLIDFRARLSEVFRAKYPALRSRDFVPTLDGPIQATSTGFIGEFLSRVGEAKMVTAASTDVPLVRVTGTTFNGTLVYYGAAGSWQQLDVFRASIGQINLPVETQKAARETIETMTDKLIAIGDSDTGVKGFLNNPNVAIIPLTTGAWNNVARTFAEVMADFHLWIGAIHARVGYIESSMPDTVIFAPGVKNVLAKIRNPGDNKLTAWTTLVSEAMEHYGITVETWSRLATASATGGARAVAYRRDKRVLGSIVSMEYQEFPPQERGFDIIVPAIAGCGGTVIIEDRAVTYTDNTLS